MGSSGGVAGRAPRSEPGLAAATRHPARPRRPLPWSTSARFPIPPSTPCTVRSAHRTGARALRRREIDLKELEKYSPEALKKKSFNSNGAAVMTAPPEKLRAEEISSPTAKAKGNVKGKGGKNLNLASEAEEAPKQRSDWMQKKKTAEPESKKKKGGYGGH